MIGRRKRWSTPQRPCVRSGTLCGSSTTSKRTPLGTPASKLVAENLPQTDDDRNTTAGTKLSRMVSSKRRYYERLRRTNGRVVNRRPR
jgi:hypothetical protein